MRVSFGFYGAALALAFLAVGCGGDPGYKEMLGGYKEGVDAMKGIKDEDSAKVANDKLKAAAEKIKAGSSKIKEPTEGQKKEMEDLSKQFTAEQERINKLDPKVKMAAGEGMLTFGFAATMAGSMDKLKDLFKK